MTEEENKEMITITIPMEEYKELLIIKGKYEELKSQTKQPIIWNGYTDKGTTILPCRDTGEFQTTSQVVAPPYKITCKGE